ncbi:hypothetical protein [Arthrobacter ramosus]|uniref:Uncharacterized protein n=1 Tax=Arthrobacter ramosus TaxID=1672 RepID=A0ABV5XW61_ARTRM|nr:hypothetical protein [Arthrobacter ramosus]
MGFVSVLEAGFNGGSFLNYGEDYSSMFMASLFAVATGSYAFGVYLLGRRERQPQVVAGESRTRRTPGFRRHKPPSRPPAGP